MIKKLCRWVLKEEISSLQAACEGNRNLAKRLAVRLRGFIGPITSDDGTGDYSDIIEANMDISQGLEEPCFFPIGSYALNQNIAVPHFNLKEE